MTVATEKNSLHITDPTGDTRILWDPRNKDEVAVAKASFDKAKAKGMLAYRVDKDSGDSSGEVMRDFDKTAGKVIMVPQLVGG